MKTIVLTLVAACVSVGLFASEPTKSEKPRLSLSEIKRLRIERDGGLVDRPTKDPGVCFANSQKRVPVKVMEQVTKEMTQLLGISVFVAEEQYSTITTLTATKANSPHAVIIAVSEMPGLPALLVAPDADWAVINMSALAGDNPTKEQLNDRLVKEMWRAFGRVLGSGWTSLQGCLMKKAASNQALDKIFGKTIGPEALQSVFNNISTGDFAKGGAVTYKQACQEGWAPAPTNEIQKAVWDKVHALPTEPIKIKPEMKKVTQ